MPKKKECVAITQISIYVLTKRTQHSLKKRGKNLTCRICGEKIDVGEKLIKKSNIMSYRHLKCLEESYYDI